MSTVAAEAQHEQPSILSSSVNIDRHQRHDGSQILRQAVAAQSPRHDWTKEEISAIYYQPLMELTYQAVSLEL